MTARSGANTSGWWIACILTGCSPYGEAESTGASLGDGVAIFGDAPRDGYRRLRSHVGKNPAKAKAPSVSTVASQLPAEEPSDRPGGGISSTATASAPAARYRPTERELRNAFASASDPTQSGIALAGHLVRGERYFDALFVIDEALKRSRTIPLRLARAGLLRDVARCDLAASEIHSVVREVGADNLTAGTLFDLVQVQWVAGRRQAALESLRNLKQSHASDPWLHEHARELVHWRERLEEPQGNQDPLANGELRDMYALLRAAPAVTARLKMLNSLADPAEAASVVRAQEDQRRPVRMRAIAIACGDDSPAVRTRAVQLALANQIADLPFWDAALADESALVRSFAATGAAKQLGRDASQALWAALQLEQDQAAFKSLHIALARARGLTTPPCDCETESDRAAVVAYWRTKCVD